MEKEKILLKVVPLTAYFEDSEVTVVIPGKAPLRMTKDDFEKKFGDCVSLRAMRVSMGAIVGNTKARIEEIESKGISDKAIDDAKDDVRRMENLLEKLESYENKNQ